MDNTDNINLPYLCEKISNIPIKLPLMLDEIKSSIGFLEMYKVVLLVCQFRHFRISKIFF